MRAIRRRSTRGCACTRSRRWRRLRAPIGSAPTPLPPLWGIPVGLKDLYAVAGRPLTASSSLLDERPEADCDVWARLRARGMILLGHLHTHEFAVGGTTDQVGNPWALERTAGGSSGGSAAALAARMVPGRDRHRHRRLAAHPLGALAAPRRSSPRAAWSRCAASSRWPRASITPGRWRARSRTAHCCCEAMAGPDLGRPGSALAGGPPARSRGRARPQPLAGVRLARLAPARTGRARRRCGGRRSPAALAACEQLGAVLVEPPPPAVAARHRRGVPRRALRGAARLPPPLRRPSRALPALAAGVGGAGRGARHLGRALCRRAAIAPRDDRRLRAVAPGRAHHRRARADGALRRARCAATATTTPAATSS